MEKYWTLLLLLICINSWSQQKFPSDPDSALFVTTDIANFWMAFDDFKKDSTVNNFGKKYIDIGSKGVKGFVPNRIQSAEHLYSTVKRKHGSYENVRQSTLRVIEKEKRCRSSFYSLKYWYSQATFPPVYFVIGAYNSGGTVNEDGIFIGAEMQTDINSIPGIVAHELIHFQQKNWKEEPTLLEQSIVEGSADFLGELISGENINYSIYAYGEKNKESLCKEFVKRMDGTNYIDWLYGVSGTDDRPSDLGYWMGYKITAQYFKNAVDKKRAIREILDIKNCKEFLRMSGYLKGYVQNEKSPGH